MTATQSNMGIFVFILVEYTKRLSAVRSNVLNKEPVHRPLVMLRVSDFSSARTLLCVWNKRQHGKKAHRDCVTHIKRTVLVLYACKKLETALNLKTLNHDRLAAGQQVCEGQSIDLGCKRRDAEGS